LLTFRPTQIRDESHGYRRAIWTVAAATLGVALAEGAWAQAVGSKDLLKDASSFGYDIGLNVISALVFGRGARVERLSALAIAALLVIGGLNGLVDLWADIQSPERSSIGEVAVSSVFGIAAAGFAAATLVRFRRSQNPLIQATWLNARNDVIAAGLTAFLAVLAGLAPVRWPEYALELVGVLLTFQAAATVLMSARRDLRSIKLATGLAAPARPLR
jgi:Co/Zn/Cd efflux system component